MSTITLSLPGHGDYTVTDSALTAAMARYLPASPRELRALTVERATGASVANLPDGDALATLDLAGCLVMLADFDTVPEPTASAWYVYRCSGDGIDFRDDWCGPFVTESGALADCADSQRWGWSASVYPADDLTRDQVREWDSAMRRARGGK